MAKKKAAKKTAKAASPKKANPKRAKKAASRPAKKAAKKTVKKTAPKAGKKTAKKATLRPAKKAAKKTIPKASKKATPKATLRPAKKAAKKTVKKTPRPKAGHIQAKDKRPVQAALPSATPPPAQTETQKTVELAAPPPPNPLEEALEKIGQLDFYQNESDECLERGCDHPSSTGNYCRLHYIKNWKDIKKKEDVLRSGQLQNYIRSLAKTTSNSQLLGAILSDLNNEKSFFAALEDMDIDAAEESFEDLEDEVGGDDQDMAFETKTGSKSVFED